jgi:hypothetical protein
MTIEEMIEFPKNVQELIKFKEDNYLSVGETLNMLRELEIKERNKIEVPAYKSKPRFNNSSPSSKELKEAAAKVEEWEKYDRKRKRLSKKRRDAVPNMGDICAEFIKIESGLKDKVPAKYQSKVYSFAWDKGHGSGYMEVYNYLLDLVNIFE